MIGERIAHYQVVAELGRGGMGVVYRATDLKLSRDVALKFLPDGFAPHSDVLERFAREARSAAALNHPHICTIHEIGEHEGRPFIAMELLEGRTLAEQISARPLTIGLSIELALQIASALEAAHAKGIVHRDVKPANIFITSSGNAKVLDFGLAKSAAVASGRPDDATVADSGNLTVAGSTMGTVAYMSPEQARGQDLDGRSDVFSLGLVLYEMVTGRRAFDGETSAVIFDGILNRTPPAPSELNSDVPPELERIIGKAIEKDRALRYQTAGELAADLRGLKRRSDSGGALTATAAVSPQSGTRWSSAANQTAAPAAAPPAPARRLGWSRVLPIAAALIVAAGIAWWQLGGPSQALGEADVILIADFGNSTGDPVFDGTLKQALAVKLEESPFLNVLSDQRVSETLAFMNRAAETPVTQAVAREICQRQGIKAAILGDIAPLGSTYVVTLTAENCQTGDVLGREQAIARGKEQVLASLGEAATSMRSRLGESLASISQNDKPIEQATTSSLEALKAFSLGNEKRNTAGDQESIPFFRRALELDADFALAHARLGTVYSNRGDRSRAVEHRTRAYELRDRVSERERLYITAHYYSGVKDDAGKALETYDVWKQTYPRDPVPHHNSGIIYGRRGEAERALEAYLKALELDPRLRLGYSNAIGKYIDLNRLDEARALVDRQIASLGESPDTHHHLYDIAARQYDRAAMDRHAAVLENSPLAANFLGVRSAEMAYYGRFSESERLHARQIELLQREGLKDRVAIALSDQAITASFLGEAKVAREHAEAVTKAGLDKSENLDVQANLAFVYASLGDESRARRHFRGVKLDALPDPGLGGLIVQTFEGLLALNTGRLREAVERLKDLPLERDHSLVNDALFTRAEAYRRARHFVEAERDYRALLARKHPYPFSMLVPFGTLGLARTLAASGNAAAALAEYQKVLDLWSGADPDLAIVREVRAEVAKLGT